MIELAEQLGAQAFELAVAPRHDHVVEHGRPSSSSASVCSSIACCCSGGSASKMPIWNSSVSSPRSPCANAATAEPRAARRLARPDSRGGATLVEQGDGEKPRLETFEQRDVDAELAGGLGDEPIDVGVDDVGQQVPCGSIAVVRIVRCCAAASTSSRSSSMTMRSARSMRASIEGGSGVARPQHVHRAEQRDLAAVAAGHAPRGGSAAASPAGSVTPSNASQDLSIMSVGRRRPR